MNTGARLGALRFMLGLAAGQVEFDSAEEREASLREAVAYLVGFVRPLVQLLLAAREAPLKVDVPLNKCSKQVWIN
jgi:hypothetical protein